MMMTKTNINLTELLPFIKLTHIHSGTSVHKRLSSWTNRFTNMQASNNGWWQARSISCCVTSAQYTCLLEFAVPFLEFHCVLWFFNILLNKTPWDQRRINKQSSGVQERINPFYIVFYGKNSFGLRTFRVTNGLQEQIKFVNRGSNAHK
jgi:hypothetical protein